MSGRVIAGRYRLDEPIGRGAMGVVWRARDELLDRDVAVKEVLISEALSDDERANSYQRTLREARTAARLSHRGVVAIYDVAEEDGRPWIIMELVPAKSLDQIVTESGPISPRRAGRVGQQLLAALASAHMAGVLHRDVKPSNVLLGSDGRAVLTDFGIATFQGDPRLTQTGMVMGSPGYTAPERIRGGPATPASDLWSLGATLYTAVEGHGPFEKRGGAITTMSAITHEDPPPCPAAGPLAGIILALLRREPSGRPDAQTAARLIANLLPLLPDEHVPETLRVPSPAGAPFSSASAAAVPGASAVGTTVAGGGVGATVVAGADVAAAASAVAAASAEAGTALDGLQNGFQGGVLGGTHVGASRGATGLADGSSAPVRGDPPTMPQQYSAQTTSDAPKRRRWWLVGLVAAVLAACVGVGVAMAMQGGTTPTTTTNATGATGATTAIPIVTQAHNDALRALDHPVGTAPAGFTPFSETPADTLAGFSIDMAPGWFSKHSATSPLAWALHNAGQTASLEIDLTAQNAPDAYREASSLKQQDLSKGTLSGYQEYALGRADIRGTNGAVWEFGWTDRSGARLRAEDLLFNENGQSYALFLVANAADWDTVMPVFQQELKTFQP
jgi:eukaryotic-like serine/threonine-protein kinase